MNSATLIDNIFTNNIYSSHSITSGIFFNDVSDHLPIFQVTGKNVDNQVKTEIHANRIINETTVNSLKSDLHAEDWNDVMNINDTEKA